VVLKNHGEKQICLNIQYSSKNQ